MVLPYTDGMVVRRESVTITHDSRSVTIVGNEVNIANMDSQFAPSLAQPIYDVRLAADRDSLSVPGEFFQTGIRNEMEVVTIEESGNQTINNGYFATE